MKITETTTETKTEKVEETETIERIKCDVCAHEYTVDEWDGKEFAVSPDIDRQVHSIYELDKLFNAYHTEIPTHVIDDGYDGAEMNFEVPERNFLDVLDEELPLASERHNLSPGERMLLADKRRPYEGKLGTEHFYLKNNTIHHFMYEISLEASTEDYKHVCNDCYDVIFD